MQHGDISNVSGYTVGWDFRLFLNIRYPRLFQFLISHKWYWLSSITYTYVPEAFRNLERIKNQNCVILITHQTLEKLFEGYSLMHIHSEYYFDHLDLDSIVSPDMRWVMASRRVKYMLPFQTKFKPHKGFKKWFLTYIDKELLKRFYG